MNAPRGLNATAAAVDTYLVQNFIFNADHNTATQVDTVRIQTGQTILWLWVNGTHTTTSGTGPTDPGAGTLWDQPMDTTHHSFSFTFNSTGTFPFFCRVHPSVMKGVVVVRTSTGVSPIDGPEKPGFTVGPSPNPTREGATFRFVLRSPGRVRVEVFDVAGRSLAIPLQEDLAAGVHDSAWDGRDSSGKFVPAGVYFVKLSAPGVEESRRLVVAR